MALVREGLTNEQIAQRLDISLDGAKYHVSKILSKLQVRDRVEAARWYERHRTRRQPVAALLGLLRAGASPGRLAAGALLAVVLAGLVVLLAGVLLMSSRSQPEEEPPLALAPDGRTGDELLDALIEGLLHDGAASLEARFPGVTAREERLVLESPLTHQTDSVDLSVAQWTQRLAESPRSLYAVFTRDLRTHVMLEVNAGAEHAEAWRFAVRNGELVEVDIRTAPGELPDWAAWIVPLARSHTPSPHLEFERFLVLPPEPELPEVPRSHPLSVTTGHAGVDRLLATLGTRAADRLLAAMAPLDELPVRQCGVWEGLDAWAEATAAASLRLHAVARLPDGYQPSADHAIILVAPIHPYRWQAMVLYESRGEIAGLMPPCEVPPRALYPPDTYLLPPLQESLNALDTTRRSDNGTIDAFLDALQVRDAAALDAMIDYPEVPCVALSQLFPGAPTPHCPEGLPAGTPVEALATNCMGEHVLREHAVTSLITWLGGTGLYAVIDTPRDGAGGSSAQIAVMAREVEPYPGSAEPDVVFGGMAAVVFHGDRVVDIQVPGCGGTEAIWLTAGAEPSFLLPPP